MRALKRFLIVIAVGTISFLLTYNIVIRVWPPVANIDGKRYLLMPTGQIITSVFVSFFVALASLYFIVQKSK